MPKIFCKQFWSNLLSKYISGFYYAENEGVGMCTIFEKIDNIIEWKNYERTKSAFTIEWHNWEIIQTVM